MAIELSKDQREQAIHSLQRYFDEQLDQKIGNIAASGLLSYFLAEIGPAVYNQAVRDAFERLHQRVDDLGYEVEQNEFAYWKSLTLLDKKQNKT